jgi:hypothetical protein
MKAQQSKSPAVAPTNPPVAAANKNAGKKGREPATKRSEPSGKLGKVVALLRRPKGATIADLTKATQWQAHSVRGAISGTIKKKLKLTVLSEKAGEVRTYRIKG